MELISSAEAGAILGCHAESVRCRAAEGKLTTLNTRGEPASTKEWKQFSREEVVALAEAERAVLGRGDDAEWISVEEAMRILQINRKSIARLACRGRLLARKIRTGLPGKNLQWVYRREDVEAYQGDSGLRPRLVKTVPITATRDDLIWFAGFFDGEGCVSIQRRKIDGGGWHLSLLVPNTAHRVIRGLPALFGGSVFHIKCLPHQWQPQMRWRVSGRQAGLVLHALLPYLRVKHRQAEVAVEFQERMDKSSNNGHRPVSEADRAWRDAAYEKVRWLNHHYE